VAGLLLNFVLRARRKEGEITDLMEATSVLKTNSNEFRLVIDRKARRAPLWHKLVIMQAPAIRLNL